MKRRNKVFPFTARLVCLTTTEFCVLGYTEMFLRKAVIVKDSTGYELENAILSGAILSAGDTDV